MTVTGDLGRVYPPDGVAQVKERGGEQARVWNDQYPGHPSDAGGTPPPAASFTYSPYPTGQTVNTTFDGSGSTPGYPDAPITAWDWLFDNSATRSGPVVTWRTPNGAGDYPATLTVTAADGQTASQTQVLSI